MIIIVIYNNNNNNNNKGRLVYKKASRCWMWLRPEENNPFLNAEKGNENRQLQSLRRQFSRRKLVGGKNIEHFGLREGKRTQFFHHLANQHHRSNTIGRLSMEGEVFTDDWPGGHWCKIVLYFIFQLEFICWRTEMPFVGWTTLLSHWWWEGKLGGRYLPVITWSNEVHFSYWCCMCRCNGKMVDRLLMHCEVAHDLCIWVIQLFGIQWVLPRNCKYFVWVEELVWGSFINIWNFVPLCLM